MAKDREIGVSLETPDGVRRLQRKLYVKAKQEPEYRFYLLYDKVHRDDILTHAYRLSRAARGAAGVDGLTFDDIEAAGVERWLAALGKELREQTYRPAPVRRVMIPKPGGGERPLGIPTIRDRVAQTAAKLVLEPIFEADFEDSAYGYRPRRSAHDAVRAVHTALCEGYTDVVDADLSKYFDTIPHHELLQSVARRVEDRHVLRLVKMWLKVPVEERDERGRRRMSGGKRSTRGTPQGGVISPLLANLFLHYAFDRWMAKQYQQLSFERFADDAIVHCRTEGEAQEVRAAIAARLQECGLELHPEKTKVVYCKDDDRRRTYPNEKFDFLGYTFRPRRSKNRKGKYFINFSPAVSDKAVKAIRAEIRHWNLHLRSDKSIEDLSRMFNPIIRGWLRYYGRFYRSALYPPMRQLDRSLARWAHRKYKKLRGHLRRATHWVARI